MSWMTCTCTGVVVDTDLSDSVGSVVHQPADSGTERCSIGQPSLAAALRAVDVNHLRLLATYALLPRGLDATVRPLQLARIGFFYAGRRLRCYFCNIELALLEGYESYATARHSVLSPTCRLDGHRHSSSEALLRAILLWAPLAVQVRQDDVSLRALKIKIKLS